MGTLDKITDDIGESLFGLEDPPDPTPAPDPTVARAEAEEDAAQKNDSRRRRINEGGRQSTIHALGTTEEQNKDTLG